MSATIKNSVFPCFCPCRAKQGKLFISRRLEDRRQRVAEVHRADFAPLGGANLRLVPRPVVLLHKGGGLVIRPHEKESIRKKLRDMEAEAKRRKSERRQESQHRSYDYDRGR